MKSEYNIQVFVHIVQCTVVVVSYFFLIQLLYQNVPYGYRLADKQPNNIMIYRWHILVLPLGCSSQHAQGKNTNLFWQVLDSPQWLGQETVNVEYHFNVWTLLCTPQFYIQSSFHLPLSGVLTIGVSLSQITKIYLDRYTAKTKRDPPCIT